MRSLSRTANTVFAVSWLLKSRSISKATNIVLCRGPVFSEAPKAVTGSIFNLPKTAAKDQRIESRGPGNQRTGGPRDQRTRTRGPKNQRTRGPEDQGTRGPGALGEPNQGRAKAWKKKKWPGLGTLSLKCYGSSRVLFHSRRFFKS